MLCVLLEFFSYSLVLSLYSTLLSCIYLLAYIIYMCMCVCWTHTRMRANSLQQFAKDWITDCQGTIETTFVWLCWTEREAGRVLYGDRFKKKTCYLTCPCCYTAVAGCCCCCVYSYTAYQTRERNAQEYIELVAKHWQSVKDLAKRETLLYETDSTERERERNI